jgi:hypothetical protein
MQKLVAILDLFVNSSETTHNPSEGRELFASLGCVFLFPSFGGGMGGLGEVKGGFFRCSFFVVLMYF